MTSGGVLGIEDWKVLSSLSFRAAVTTATGNRCTQLSCRNDSQRELSQDYQCDLKKNPIVSVSKNARIWRKSYPLFPVLQTAGKMP